MKSKPKKKSTSKRTTRRSKREFPLATIAYYGPDNRFASKVAVGIMHNEDNVIALERWLSDSLDVRRRTDITQAIITFITSHNVKSVIITDHIIGCPHEEGIDYPVGETCPQCPFWTVRERWTSEAIS